MLRRSACMAAQLYVVTCRRMALHTVAAWPVSSLLRNAARPPGNFMFDPATHRDFLGALLGTGVVRDRVGVSSSRQQQQQRCH